MGTIACIDVMPFLRTLMHGSHFVINTCIVLLVLSVFSPHWEPDGIFFSRLPLLAQVVALSLLLDFAAYGLHTLSHRNSLLWYFHQVHHSDDKVDASTGLRMHFMQMFISLIPDLFILSLLSPKREAYWIYTGIAYLSVLFHHSRLALPNWAITILSRFFVTPLFHQEHHRRENRGNFGSIYSFWDALLGTRAIPKSGPFGLPAVSDPFSFRELFLPPKRSLG